MLNYIIKSQHLGLQLSSEFHRHIVRREPLPWDVWAHLHGHEEGIA